VAAHWGSFDCAIVVMDGKHGVNTDTPIGLLEFVKSNLANQRNIPVISSCNKIDDPEDEEQAELVAEARSEVETIFEAPNRDGSLHELLLSTTTLMADAFPVFLPISAANAYIFRCAALMGLEKFKTFDPKLVEKIGKDRVGKDVWRSLKKDEKLSEAFQVITDPARYAAAMEESNFDTFLSVLSKAIGGVAVQEKMIEAQIKIELNKISSQTNIAEQLYTVYQKTKLLAHNQEPTEAAITAFQKLFADTYQELEDDAFAKFIGPTAVDALAAPMQQLIRYYNLAATLQWKDECKVVIGKMTSLIRRQIEVVTDHETVSEGCLWKLSKPSSSDVPSWDKLLPLDWINLLGSFNLLGCDVQLNTAFNSEKISIDLLKHKATAWTDKHKGNYGNFICLCERPLSENYCCNSCHFQFIKADSKAFVYAIVKVLICLRPAKAFAAAKLIRSCQTLTRQTIATIVEKMYVQTLVPKKKRTRRVVTTAAAISISSRRLHLSAALNVITR
jgi:hypothetical protein